MKIDEKNKSDVQSVENEFIEVDLKPWSEFELSRSLSTSRIISNRIIVFFGRMTKLVNKEDFA